MSDHPRVYLTDEVINYRAGQSVMYSLQYADRGWIQDLALLDANGNRLFGNNSPATDSYRSVSGTAGTVEYWRDKKGDSNVFNGDWHTVKFTSSANLAPGVYTIYLDIKNQHGNPLAPTWEEKYWIQFTVSRTSEVIYSTGEGTSLAPTVKVHTQSSGAVAIQIRSDTPSRQWHTFLHWTDPYGNILRPGGTAYAPYNGSVTLTAQWQRNTHTITIKSDRGSGDRVYTGQNEGETFTLPDDTDSQYNLKGFAIADGGDIAYSVGDSFQILTDVTLYAVWNLRFNEEKMVLADNSEIYLKDITWYPSDQRTVEVGTGETDALLSNAKYTGVQFVPVNLVEQYPLAFGIFPADMRSIDNPDLEYSNVYVDGVLTIKFNAQAGGYRRGLVKMAVVDVGTMSGFILSAYLAQETDVTTYTVVLSRYEGDSEPMTYPDLVGSYRNPYVFYFPYLQLGLDVVDKWVSEETGKEYNIGDSVSLTGRYVTAKQTLRFIAKTVRKETVLAFSPQGGSFGPSPLREVSETDVTFTVPESGISKRGAVFKGWSDSPDSSVMYRANDTVTVKAGSTMTLYAVWETSTEPFTAQGELHLPYCGIMIYKRNGAFFNATFYQHEGELAVIHKAENQPGSATFTLANISADPTQRLCADTFAQWSDGTPEAIKPGMYVRLLNITSKTDADLIMDGRITTMTPTEDMVVFEIGDGKAFLGKTGTWLRRNYRNAESTKVEVLDGYVDRDGILTVNIDLDGEAMAAYRVRSTPVDVSVTRSSQTTPFRGRFLEAVAGRTFKTIRRIEFDYSYDLYNEFYPESTIEFRLTVGSTITDQSLGVVIASGQGSGRMEYNVGFVDFNSEDAVTLAYGLTGVNYGTVTVRNITFILDNEETVAVPDRIYSDTADEQDRKDPSKRLRVVYVSEAIPVKKIMEDMAVALGYEIRPHRDLPNNTLAIFRAGGSYALSYFQKLADQKEKGTFRTMSFDVEGASPKIFVGTRYSIRDAPRYLIKYGGDRRPEGAESLPVLDIHRFAPKMTLKNRPNLITLKANLKDNRTFIVSFEDIDSTDMRGVTIEKIVSDSSASDVNGVGTAAFAELSSVELDRWEGEVIVPGIVRGLMSEDDRSHAGSGVPVIIQDSRFGMDSYKARVRQVTYDYSACVTRIILDNYDMMYSSGIASTNALAVEVGDLVGGISDTTLYNQQYLYLKTAEEWKSGDRPTLEILTKDPTKTFKVGADDITVFELPNGTVVTTCSFMTDAEHYLPEDKPYGVTGIKLVGKTELEITVPLKREPDLFLGQTLSICVLTHGGL